MKNILPSEINAAKRALELGAHRGFYGASFAITDRETRKADKCDYGQLYDWSRTAGGD